jgi:hypothetical protein
MTTDLDARWAVLAAETQHDGMRDSLRRRLHRRDAGRDATGVEGQGPRALILADRGYQSDLRAKPLDFCY